MSFVNEDNSHTPFFTITPNNYYQIGRGKKKIYNIYNIMKTKINKRYKNKSQKKRNIQRNSKKSKSMRMRNIRRNTQNKKILSKKNYKKNNVLKKYTSSAIMKNNGSRSSIAGGTLVLGGNSDYNQILTGSGYSFDPNSTNGLSALANPIPISPISVQ